MNRALLRKEWLQARAGILITGGMLTAFWFGLYSPEEVLFGGSGPGWINLVLVLMAGLTVPLAQFASESILGTRDVLVFRATGPGQAFGAKLAVGMAAATLLGVGPVLVWAAWQALTFRGAAGADWGRVLPFVQLGTLTWACWGVVALACQLRRGWGTRATALILGAGTVLALASTGMERLASAPLWADWLVPLGSAAVAVGFAWCAERAFVAGVDDELPLRDGPGLTLGLGAAAALGLPLCLLGPCVSSSVRDRLRSDFPRVVETEDGLLALRDGHGWFAHPWTWGRVDIDVPPGVSQVVLDPSWEELGWPAPTAVTASAGSGHHSMVGGNYRWLTVLGFSPTSGTRRVAGALPIESYFESRSRTVRIYDRRPDRLRHDVVDLGWSPSTHVLLGGAASLLADVGHGTLTLVREQDGRIQLDALELPGGDRLVGVEPLVDRSAAVIGWIPPYTRNGLLLRGERGLYRFASNDEPVLQPHTLGEEDRWVPMSRVGEIARFETGYAEYDGLDPVIEVRDARSGEPLLTARLAPPGARTARLKSLVMASGFLHPAVDSLVSFLDPRPWRSSSLDLNPALAGGRRPWLLALQLAFSVWLARRVRGETRAWGRSPWLGRFWVVVTLVLGVPGWLLFRLVEPSARVSRAGARERGAARPGWFATSAARAEVAR